MIFWVDDQALVLESIKAICKDLNIECYTYNLDEISEAEYQSNLVNGILVYGHLGQYKNTMGIISLADELVKPLNFLTLRDFILQVTGR